MGEGLLVEIGVGVFVAGNFVGVDVSLTASAAHAVTIKTRVIFIRRSTNVLIDDFFAVIGNTCVNDQRHDY